LSAKQEGALTCEVKQGRFWRSRAGRQHNGHRASGDSFPRVLGFFTFGREHGKRRMRCSQDIAHSTGPLRHKN